MQVIFLFCISELTPVEVSSCYITNIIIIITLVLCKKCLNVLELAFFSRIVKYKPLYFTS